MESAPGLEPSAALLKGRSPARIVKRLFLATRPKFFTASILPVLIGTVWGYKAAGQFDLTAFALALAAIVCAHAGVNVLNDVFDELGGSDRVNRDRIYPYTGGSRFIQNGVMTVAEMARWGVALIGVGMVFGALLVAFKGIGVLLFGLVGIALGTLYSIPPVQLSARGLGEAAVTVGFGVLPVTGATWLQSGVIDAAVLLVSIPISMWVGNILLINEVPDIRADAQAGKRTLPVRLGRKATSVLYFCVHAVAVLAIALAVTKQWLPLPAIVLPAVLLLAGASAARAIGKRGENDQGLKRGIELTLAIHALGGFWLTGWIWYAAP
jgi:1,4-dihydroxy-2-naphthoate polyprenyltransferase